MFEGVVLEAFEALEGMMARYEGSKADKKEDAKGAKAAGTTLKAYEKGRRDKKEDRAGQAKLDKQRKC